MNAIPKDRQVFQMEIDVKPDDIDELNHVNNVVYVQWIQDVAAAHWNHSAPAELRNACVWVVRRHEIDYKLPALPDDQLTAATWIDQASGPFQKRYVRITRTIDHKLLAEACTTWCLLDPVSGKPKRVSEEISISLGLKDKIGE